MRTAADNTFFLSFLKSSVDIPVLTNKQNTQDRTSMCKRKRELEYITRSTMWLLKNCFFFLFTLNVYAALRYQVVYNYLHFKFFQSYIRNNVLARIDFLRNSEHELHTL